MQPQRAEGRKQICALRKQSSSVLYACRGQAVACVSSELKWRLSADGYTLNDGSCACHKQWGWFTNACEGSFCFDYIGEAQQESRMVVWQSKPLPGRDVTAGVAEPLQKGLAAGSACCRVPQSAGGAGLHGSPNSQTYACSHNIPAAGRWAGLSCSQLVHHAGAMASGSCRVQQSAQQEEVCGN